MNSTVYEFSEVPEAIRAAGYRARPDGSFVEEPPLPHGVFGSTGGLLTNAGDMGKYLAFQLSAWPPRDDADAGPVRRGSLREMSHLWTPANLGVKRADGKLQAVMGGYGYGLRIFSDCRFEHIVAHGGGLPGFGSYMAWLPDYGIGMFAMATLTYSGPAEALSSAWDVFLKTGGLQRRQLPPSPALIDARVHILKLWNAWDDAQARNIAAMNLLIDVPAAQRREQMQAIKTEVGGECTAGPLRSENWLRGQFNLSCPKGTVGVFFTMSPTKPPAVQHLEFRKLDADSTLMGAPTGAPAGVSCSD